MATQLIKLEKLIYGKKGERSESAEIEHDKAETLMDEIKN